MVGALCAILRARPRRCALAAVLLLVLLADALFPLPLPGRNAAHALLVVARDGSPLRAFPDRQHVWRHPVTPDEVSPRYLEALLTYEDRLFYWHPGVNPYALARAAWQWGRHGQVVSGGSTLTMQVARILEPTPRTVAGKLRQTLRALQLELHLSKDEILALYLSYAPMGGVLEGVEAASRAYLGKPAMRLSHAEAALLTVLPQAPSLLRPDRYPEAARAARDKVLHRLAGRWGRDVVAEALAEPPYAQTLRQPLLAPLLAERLKRDMERDLEQARAHPASLWSSFSPPAPPPSRVASTIDAAAQTAVEALLLDRARALPPRVSLAALVMDNASLEVPAYAGSADFGDPERFSHVDMVRASRSPGSALKPFLYALALDEGLIHSESLLADAPQSFGGYQPGNFQQSFHGPVSVSEALIKSLNVPAVEVLERLGPTRFVAALRSGGLKLDFPENADPNLSVILGGAGTTLEGLVAAYSSLARQGLAGTPRLLPDEPRSERRMMSAGAAFIIRDILESGGPMGRVTGDSRDLRRGIAWKTGTSFGFRDAWAVGVSDRYTVGVWVGRPDGTPNPGFFGANVAAPLLVDIFSALPEPPVPSLRTPPPGVSQVRICWPLGTRVREDESPLCHSQRTAWVLADTAPPTFPDRLRGGSARVRYQVDPASGRRVEADCSSGPVREVEAARWPAVLEPWLDASTARRALPPPWAAACGERHRAEAGLAIVGLNDGAILRRANGSAAPTVEVDVRGFQGEVSWLVNGRLVARSLAGRGQLLTFATPGRYDVTAIDGGGRYDRVSVSVQSP